MQSYIQPNATMLFLIENMRILEADSLNVSFIQQLYMLLYNTAFNSYFMLLLYIPIVGSVQALYNAIFPVSFLQYAIIDYIAFCSYIILYIQNNIVAKHNIAITIQFLGYLQEYILVNILLPNNNNCYTSSNNSFQPIDKVL